MAMLLLALLLLATATAPALGDDDQVAFYFSDFEENLEDLSLLGDAKFVRIEGQVDGMAVQLSGTAENTAGRLLYSLPVRMLDAKGKSSSFSTQFCFSMSSFAGDGLAFIIVPDLTSIGASGPWLGLVRGGDNATAPHTFAVEFDSVKNEELRDPNSNHVGLDVETIVSAVTADATDVAVTLNDGLRKFAWVDYDGNTNLLEVRVAGSDGIKPEAPLMSHKLELAKIWKPWMFVGFSSSTGSASQKHKVFSWRFSCGTGSKEDEREQNKHPQLEDANFSLSGLRMHSVPLDPFAKSLAPDSEDDGGDGGDDPTKKHSRFDPGMLILLLVGFTCGACITLFLLVGWALMLRRNSERMGYEELS